MRLLQTKTLEFEEFLDSQLPRYAILSHRWGKKEVSYKEMRKFQKETSGATEKKRLKAAQSFGPGMAKIMNFCSKAFDDRLQWAWIDTCCIDKRSSAELSESINAMYKWYARSSWCYIYLNDVVFPTPQEQANTGHDSLAWHTRFRKSEWFTRGWTLQELLAPNPSQVSFFDVRWTYIDYLNNLVAEVAAITGISIRYLIGKNSIFPNMERLKKVSIAQMMSWASRRNTSREEDIAYCLLGLFNVNMPLLYGEGAGKAFHRLQTEIMAQSDDESLFAWTADRPLSGLLASSPADFANSHDIFEFSPDRPRRPYSMTHKGLKISIPKDHLQEDGHGHIKGQIYLNCTRPPLEESNGGGLHCAVVLQLKGDGEIDGYSKTWRVCNVLESSRNVGIDALHSGLLFGETRTIYVDSFKNA
ncbi:MAG: hypothetical protein Q9169_002721 [Polycauliona sp. 2 TL-2023]